MGNPRESSQSAAPTALPPRLVFFDGVCGLCNRAVDRLLSADPEGLLRFAPLQGETAEAWRQAYPGRFPKDLDSIVLMERRGDGLVEFSLRSEAAFRLAALLGLGGVWARALAKFPRFLTDPIYWLVARSRYRLFGRHASCRIPAPGERDRFLP